MTTEEELIYLREQLAQRDALIEQLLQRIQDLEKRLSKDSHNSSLPPSSDRFARPKKSRSLRKSSGKKPGGQTGHQGNSLQASQTPDQRIRLPEVSCCQHCQADLSETPVKCLERRQVVDVPEPSVLVTEYQGEWKQCPHCQGFTSATFPDQVKAPVQYGPRIKALAVYLLMQQLLPWKRTQEVLSDVLGIQMSEGTLACTLAETARTLQLVEDQIKAALARAPVIHQDETGLYVQHQRWWMHVTATQALTHYQVHPKRGKPALDDIGILATFQGRSVHDCWSSYFLFPCSHALCLVHLLRELTYLAEELGLWWAMKLKRLLWEWKDGLDLAHEQGLSALPLKQRLNWQTRYLFLLAEGDLAHPVQPPQAGKRGKPAQHPARNLLNRLRTHQDAVWACLLDLNVPFDNNLAERDVRMVKVQQKVSGTFRSQQGAITFCRIRGYLSTLRKQGQHVLTALVQTLQGQPTLPSFSEAT